MKNKPTIVGEIKRGWETWDDQDFTRKGRAYWKTLISADVTRSGALTAGILKIPPGATLGEHRHPQAELYFVLGGHGLIMVGSETRSIEPGYAVFIPAGTAHSCENTGDSDLRIYYVFPEDSFEDVEYVFEG